MGEVVNLRLQRKRAVRRAAEAKADVNRREHGLSKADRTLAERRISVEQARLEGHRLDRNDLGPATAESGSEPDDRT